MDNVRPKRSSQVQSCWNQVHLWPQVIHRKPLHYLENMWQSHQMKLHSILTIHRFCICEFAFSLEFTSNPQNQYQGISWSMENMHRARKSLSYPTSTCSQLRLNKGTSAFLFQHSYCDTRPLAVYLLPWFSTCLFFLLVFRCLKKLPGTVLKCYLVSPRARRLWHALWRKHVC